jgi:hypothetical protein
MRHKNFQTGSDLPYDNNPTSFVLVLLIEIDFMVVLLGLVPLRVPLLLFLYLNKKVRL